MPLDHDDARAVLDTRARRMLGIEVPVIQAGMGYIARAPLASAVSQAGGLGVIGSTGNHTPDEVRDEIRQVKQATRAPFAVNLLFPHYDDSPEGRRMAAELRTSVDVALEEGVPVLGSGLGLPEPDIIAACRRAGTTTMATVGAVHHAVAAVEAGIDIVVAQGWEAGGHNSRVASMALLPQVTAAVDVPVLAAGGIGGGSGLVAALALGASGAYLGTAFAVCAEATVHDNFRDAVLDADERATVVSRAYSGKPVRMIANEFTRYYDDHPTELEPFPQQWAKNGDTILLSCLQGELARGPVPAGQIAGLLHERETAAQIVARVVEEAIAVLVSGLGSR